jgi:hypothetical protein
MTVYLCCLCAHGAGFLVGDDELYAAQVDTLELMRLVGADGWPARPLYTEGVSELVAAFGRARSYAATAHTPPTRLFRVN